MDNLAEKMESLREGLADPWDGERQAAGESRLQTGIQRQARNQAIARVGTLIMLLAGAAGLGSYLDDDRPEEYARSLPTSQPDNNFSDGSHGYLLGTGSSMTEVATADQDIRINLERGGGLFSVLRNENRTFRVQAGNASVEVLGTTFRVVHSGPDAVTVTVFSGRVRVRWDGTVIDELSAGETITVSAESEPQGNLQPPEPSPVTPSKTEERPIRQPEPRRRAVIAPSPASETSTITEPETETPSPDQAPSSWRDLARQGQYDEAHDAIETSGASAVTNRPADLMLAADAARLSGHPAQAINYLQQVIRSHASDPRAASAAFTLGRVLLYQLGRAAEAARAFRQCRTLRRGGPLSEDALAREVEAWARAGNMSESRRLAHDYLRIYPEGRRVHLVRQHAGLE